MDSNNRPIQDQNFTDENLERIMLEVLEEYTSSPSRDAEVTNSDSYN